jgi:hypothetical protein
VSNAPSKPVSFSRPKVRYFSNRPRIYLEYFTFIELNVLKIVGRGRAGRPDHDQQHCYHHTPTVKPDAATAVVELLIMGMRTP